MIEPSELDARVLGCAYGNYPWDEWEKTALVRGVEKSLAVLGRALMREAYQHGWSARQQSLCGWADEGRRMIALALRAPEQARQRWEWLLATDGERVDPQTYAWIGENSPTWPRLRRAWARRQNQPEN